MNKLEKKYWSEAKKYKNALDFLSSRTEETQGFVWDQLLDRPVAELVEELLRHVKPEYLKEYIDDEADKALVWSNYQFVEGAKK